ncbi:unnamed protein product [Camellia sinensis]
MALLTSCWLIIESIIIPDEFLKWYCLSFYIHPFLLFLCQIFLWIKLLQTWLLPIVSLPIQTTCFVASSIFRFITGIISLFSFIRLNNIKTVHDNSLLVEETVREPNVHVDEDISLEEYVCSDCSSNSDTQDVNITKDSSSNCGSDSHTEDVEMDVSLPSVCISDSAVMGRESIDDQSREADLDSFYQKYTDRMRWFDLFNHDRTCGISAILNKQLPPTCSFESIKQPVELTSIPHISWSKMSRSKLLRSLENDYELVYVAHSCLSWEALHYQYQKVRAVIACSASQNAAFCDNVAGRFQKFQILLERFMEDETCEGKKRYWNYVQRRSSLRGLLQVPQVSGYMEEGEDETKGEVSMRATEVLKGIEKCIKTFWIFVKTDKKKPWWKIMRGFLWTCPPLEGPRDLELLSDLTKTLQKKELWLKDLQGKKRCRLKRIVKPMEESQKKEILFTMIDIKLVARVLKMSMISTAQLKWCQEKLNNIEFKEGKVTRTCTCSLFPSS